MVPISNIAIKALEILFSKAFFIKKYIITYKNQSTPSVVLLKTVTTNTIYTLNGKYHTVTIDISDYGNTITTDNVFVELVSYSMGSSEVGYGSTAPATMSIKKSISDGVLTIDIPNVCYYWSPRTIGLSDITFNIYLVA